MVEAPYTVVLSDVGEPVEDPSGAILPSRCRAIYYESEPGQSPVPPRARSSWIEVVFELHDRTPVVTEFTVHRSVDDPLTPKGFREIRFTEVVERVVGEAAAHMAARAGRSFPTEMSDAEHAAQLASVSPFQRRRVTDDLLRQVADIARNYPTEPTKQVAGQLFTGHRNATRWIAAAKHKGFLKEEDQ